MKRDISVRRGLSTVVSIALVASAISLAAAPSASAAELAPAISVDKQLTQQIDDPTADNSVLIGEPVAYTLSVSNARGTSVGRAYNVSVTDVLPAGVGYLAGSSSIGEPKVIANAPAIGQTTLVWSNLFDVSAAGDQEFTYSVTPDVDLLPVGSSFVNNASAYATSDPFDVPTFGTTGSCATSCDYTAADTQTTVINAIEIRKNEPSPEGELMRGIHGSNSTIYTITVTNNKVRATNSIALSDAIPAGMEFLGCGAVDNTTGGLLEYVGAEPLSDVPPIAAPPCRPPLTVDTVDGDPDAAGPAPSGVYTDVTWEPFDLAPGATRTFTYRAGIPLYENTTTWPNGKPADTSGEQAANLDNNNGPSTAERLSETTYTNYARATGEYQGPGVGGIEGPVSVVAENTENVTSEDLAIRKSVSPSTFTIGGTATFTLTTRTSEYRDSAAVDIEDTLPDGLTFIPASAAATLNGAPTTLDVAVDSAVAGAVRLGFAAAGGSLPAGSTLVITFRAAMDAEYSSGAPTASGDSYVNRVATTGTTDPAVDPLDPPGGGGVEGSLSVSDISSATITSTLPANDKRIGQDRSVTDCSMQTYGDAIPTPPFQIGDTICFDLTVRFTPGSSVNNVLSPLVRDFLPTTLRFVPGSETLGPDNTLPVSQIAFSDATAGAAGGSLMWTLGEVDAQATNPGQLVVRPLAGGVGAVFQVRFAATVDSTLLDASKELTGNLLKTSGLDSSGAAYTGRDQSDFELAGSQVAVSKGVAQVNGIPATSFPPNTDNQTVKGGDLVTFRVDVTNVGTTGAGSDVPVRNLSVVDELPAGLPCATVSAVSDAGTCSDSTVPSRITWAGVPDEIASGKSKMLTYDVRIPADVSVNANYVNRATVLEYESLTNSSWITNKPVDITDVSNVRTPDASIVKTGVTSLNLPNNNLKAQFTVGEEITYTIQGSIPVGTTALNGVIRDDLPTSLQYVSSSATSSVSSDAGQSVAPGQSLPSGAALARSGRTVTLTLPRSVTNDTKAALMYSVTITAKVLGGNYTHGGGITNTARFSGSGFNRTSQYGAKVVLPNPVIAKSNDATGTVDDTDTITYTLRVTNPSPAAPALPRPTSYDTTVVDCVPAGMTFIDYGATDGATTDPAAPGDGVNGCAVGLTRIGWTVGAVAAGAAKRLTYTAKVDAGAAASETFTNIATVRGSTLDNGQLDPTVEGVYSANSSSQVRTSNGLIEKTVTPIKAAVGETVTWSIATTYQSGLSFYDAIITDALPTGVDEATVATTSVTCAPAAACASVTDSTLNPTFGSEIAPVGRTIGWNVGDVGLTSTDVTVTVVYTARVEADQSLASGDVLTNTATSRWATSNSGSLVPGTSATADLTIVRPRLSVTKSTETEAPTPGKPYSYTIVVSNDVGDGVSAAYLVEVQDSVPDGVIVDAATISNGGGLAGEGPDGGGAIAWLLDGPIAPGDSVTLTYEAMLPSSAKSGSFTNVVDIPSYSSFPTHGDPYDDVDPAEATVEVGDSFADLSIVKTPSGSATPGSTWTFTMAVSNLGPSDAEGPISVVDELPAGMTFLSEGADWTCFPYGQTVYCAYFDDLAAGASAPDLRVTVEIAATPTTATYRNIASVESLTEDPNPGNNESSATVTVSPNPVNPGPTDPTDPTNPGGPTDPTNPTNPGGTVDPGNPGGSGGSVVPQKPTQPLPLPDTVEPSRPTVVLPGGIVSNAGQPVRATVQCRPLWRYSDKVALALDGSWIPLGDTSYCSVKERSNGEVSVTVGYPGPVLVKVTYTAPKVPGYSSYSKVKRYVVVPR